MGEIPSWFGAKDYQEAIRWRIDMIAQFKREKASIDNQITKLENEVFEIDKHFKQSQNSSITNAVLSNPQKSYYTKEDYDPKWTWYQKAEFILKVTGEHNSAPEIVEILESIDKSLREDKKKKRQALSGIINTMKTKVGKTINAYYDDKSNCYRYSLME